MNEPKKSLMGEKTKSASIIQKNKIWCELTCSVYSEKQTISSEKRKQWTMRKTKIREKIKKTS